MQTPWFLWKGEDSRVRGVTVEAYPPVTRAGERSRQIRIPGRSGSLSLSGQPVCDDFALTVRISLMPGTRPPDVSRWISGSGLLVLGCDPERAVEARLTAPLALTTLPGGWHSGVLRFDCHPLKRLYPAEADITVLPTQLADPTWAGLTNPGDVPARPQFTLRGSGCLSLTWHLPGHGDPPRLTVDLRDSPWAGSGGAVFDSENMTVTTPDGSASLTALTRLENGEAEDFGLPVGATRLSAASEGGVLETLTVTPRWRWL